MITKVAIKGFRCFQNFTLDGVCPITLIAGANNVGKSAILESLFLFYDRNSNGVFLKLNAFRRINQLNLSPKMLWEPLFVNMDVNNPIKIIIENDLKETQTVTIMKDDSFSLSTYPSYISSEVNIKQVGLPIQNSYPLKICYSDANNEEISHFSLSEKGIVLSWPNSTKVVVPHIRYLSSNMTLASQEVAEFFSVIDLQGKKSQCIEILQSLEPRIKDMFVAVIGGTSGIFADIGLATRISMNMLGDGMNKLLQIVLVMLANSGTVFLIDEIENGFHYSFFPKLWEIIGKLVTMTGCQVFATTHSYECISGATVLAEDADKSELFRFVRLDLIKDAITPKAFENDSFKYAIESNWEIR